MAKTEEIIKKVPVNKTAARVISGGVHFDSTKRIAQRHSDVPLPIVAPSKGEEDQTGKRFGFFTVVGKHRNERTRGQYALWVVRCNCGNYETRRSRSIKNLNNNNDRCEACRDLVYLKNKEQYRRIESNE
ncbi:MAG TPA: hypothetical protein ENI27_03035 [bacterium]|nr:hypothetical protein [bacterium]